MSPKSTRLGVAGGHPGSSPDLPNDRAVRPLNKDAAPDPREGPAQAQQHAPIAADEDERHGTAVAQELAGEDLPEIETLLHNLRA